MIVGDTSVFAIESGIARAYEKPSLRGLGFFVIHVAGQSYGIKAPSQTMLACSFDEVAKRITGRGSHQAPFADATAIDIANAHANAIYLDNSGEGTYFGMSAAQFTKTLYSNSLEWAPDGDEAFDDSSYVLQFDVGEQVRLIAFKRPNGLVDPATVRDVSLTSDIFYNILQEWRDTFIAEWKSLPKHS
jgi:Immunity protein 42